jgi:ribosomal-protein-alanine N-acetyltransferase
MDEIAVAPMTVEHLPEVLSIERDSFSTPWSNEVFLYEMQGIDVSRSFVALSAGRVAGYMIAWFVDEEIHLINIAVAVSERQQGIGSLLLLHLIDSALEEGRKLITLEVRASNISAASLYRSFSFEYIGIRERYYSDNKEDAILMALDVEAHRLRRLSTKWEGSL